MKIQTSTGNNSSNLWDLYFHIISQFEIILTQKNKVVVIISVYICSDCHISLTKYTCTTRQHCGNKVSWNYNELQHADTNLQWEIALHFLIQVSLNSESMFLSVSVVNGISEKIVWLFCGHKNFITIQSINFTFSVIDNLPKK